VGFDSKLNLYIYLSILIALLTVICIVIQLVIIKKILRFDRTTVIRQSESQIAQQKNQTSTLAEKYNDIREIDNPSDTEEKQTKIGQKAHQDEIISESIKYVDQKSAHLFNDKNNSPSQYSEDIIMTETKDTVKNTVDQQSKPVTEAVKKVEAKPVAEAVKKVEAKPVAEAVKKVEAKPAAEAVKKVEAKPVAEAVKKVEAKPVAEAVKKPEAKPVAEVVKVTEAKPVAEAVKKVEAKPAAETVKKLDVKSTVEAVKKVELESTMQTIVNKPTDQNLEMVAPKIKLAHELNAHVNQELQNNELVQTPELIIEEITTAEEPAIEHIDVVEQTLQPIEELTKSYTSDEIITASESISSELDIIEEPVIHHESVSPKIKLAQDLITKPLTEMSQEEAIDDIVNDRSKDNDQVALLEEDVTLTEEASFVTEMPVNVEAPVQYDDLEIQTLEANIQPIRFTEAFIEKQQASNLESVLQASDVNMYTASESVAEFFQSLEDEPKKEIPTSAVHDVKVITAPIEEMKDVEDEEDDYSHLIIKPIPIHLEQDDGKKALILPPESVLDRNASSNLKAELEQDLVEKNTNLSISKASSMQTRVNVTNLSYQLFDYSDKFLSNNEVIRKDVANIEKKNVNELDISKTFANNISNLDANKELDFKKILDTYQQMADRYK